MKNAFANLSLILPQPPVDGIGIIYLNQEAP